MTQFEINTLLSIGFGFGSVFWVLVLWIIFGRR